MNRKNALRPAVVVVLLILVVSWFRLRRTGNNTDYHVPAPTGAGAHQQVIPAGASLVYTHHARCRMDCRHITETEVREVLEEGTVNETKSDATDRPCPTYAIEDRTKEGQHLRIVFARCDDVVKVVTCIDLDEEFSCHCE